MGAAEDYAHKVLKRIRQLILKKFTGYQQFVAGKPYFCNPLLRKDGAVAQSVEQRTENPCVAGSIPAHTTDTTKKPVE